MFSSTSLAVALLSVVISGHYTGLWTFPTRTLHPPLLQEVERWSCRPFLPPLFVETPPSATHPAIQAASAALDKFLSDRFSKGDIDSLSVAVITSEGAVFEKNFGLFNVLEGLILDQRQSLSWDNPVEKYLPDFKYRLDGLDASLKPPSQTDAPVTLFQLATHMSGLGRDWPPGTVSNWPHDLEGAGPPPTNGHPFPSPEALYEAISSHHLTSPPFSYPAYSNTGTGVLGLALLAASRAAEGPSAPVRYADLLKRDVFDPLGMNGSHFLATEANKHLVVVPSLAPEVADQDFLDAMKPAAGQFSSISDLIKVTQMLLNPAQPNSLLTPYSTRKWLQSVHSFEEDDWTEIGFVWEIVKARDSNGRPRKIYWKLGAMAGYHSALAIHPGSSYGITVLMGGHYPDAAKLAYDAFKIFQPAIDSALAEMATELYAGHWSASDAQGKPSSARIIVEKGTLYIESLELLGVDVLKMFGAQGRLALRSSMRRDEFRIDTGIPGYNGAEHMGCYPYWNGQDLWGVRNNAAVNLLYFTGSESHRHLHVPSLSLTLERA
ncbi:beta-lactamase/transpeptidase-like protein [Amylostereum chailletii]|nr:beta-lactamase/transpeptidase-like protein [Amylostereum chailletii]